MAKTLFVANWKLNRNFSSTAEYIDQIKDYENDNAEIVICPPYPLIGKFFDAKLQNLKLGAQNFAAFKNGAYTGEVSIEMINELGCDFSIIGHSERRQYFNESDLDVNLKTKLALKNKVTPIICIGETLKQRQNGEFKEIILEQVNKALFEISNKPIIIAYEPIWAIGSGLTAENHQIEEVFELISETAKNNNVQADKLKILYGGSANVKNLDNLLKIPNISGFLIGSASLDANNLIKMADFVK